MGGTPALTVSSPPSFPPGKASVALLNSSRLINPFCTNSLTAEQHSIHISKPGGIVAHLCKQDNIHVFNWVVGTSCHVHIDTAEGMPSCRMHTLLRPGELAAVPAHHTTPWHCRSQNFHFLSFWSNGSNSPPAIVQLSTPPRSWGPVTRSILTVFVLLQQAAET